MSASENTVTSIDGRLTVQFLWHRDRYLHRLYVGNQLAGHSVEGDAATIWPESPPLQQLSWEQIDGRMAVLGVGAAGRSHWSLSAAADEGSPAAVRLELACRCQAECDFLGSTYQLEPTVCIEPLDGTLSQREDRFIVEVAAANPATRRWAYRLVAAG